MVALVTEVDVEISQTVEGVQLMGLPTKGHAYVAWCPRCTIASDSEVNWYGQAHIVGMESAPNYEAERDADHHNEEHHTVRASLARIAMHIRRARP